MINRLRKAAEEAYNTGQDVQVNAGLILALLDRLEAAEKDAARLNWLVDNDVDAAYLFATISGTFIRDTVDAAMGEQT